ncbi:MAG TPA: heavy-metal-associated domain-containing protein [Geomonas sp.]|nr:heavy-metal-associated domain-containing protein [Geomonas sp.]
MKNKIVNISLVAAVAIILLVFGLYVRIGATADSVVVMKTSGMECGSCMAKVSKALQSEQGVAATEVDLEKGVVAAGYDSRQVSADKLARAVSKAGFASNVQAVLSPEQFRKATGHSVGRVAAGEGCCGSKGCCAK